jgi:hypothetical protein
MGSLAPHPVEINGPHGFSAETRRALKPGDFFINTYR